MLPTREQSREKGIRECVPSHLFQHPSPWAASLPLTPPTLPLPLYLIQIIDERRCTRELERQREKETDGLDTAPKAPTALAPGPGPGQAQLMGVKRVVVVGERDALFHFQHLFTSTLPSERKPDLHYIRLCTRPLSRKKTRRHFRPFFYFHEFFFF